MLTGWRSFVRNSESSRRLWEFLYLKVSLFCPPGKNLLLVKRARRSRFLRRG
ncbi:hypothetical protein NC652_014786 [Populus alba x Populus x berolinensis]|nr:hypothetical protein NC652_014786 [Populus alba x Populus x berolinensis]